MTNLKLLLVLIALGQMAFAQSIFISIGGPFGGQQISPKTPIFLQVTQSGTFYFTASVRYVKFRINWGDGEMSSGTHYMFTHTYHSPGTYNLSVSASDSSGTDLQQLWQVKVLTIPVPDCPGYNTLHRWENLSIDNYTLEFYYANINEVAYYNLKRYDQKDIDISVVPSNSTYYYDLPSGNRLEIDNCVSFVNVQNETMESHVKFSMVRTDNPKIRSPEAVYINWPNTVEANTDYKWDVFIHNLSLGIGADPEGKRSEIYVDWGDGTDSTGITDLERYDFVHAYATIGTYNQTVTEIDSTGAKSQMSSHVNVTAFACENYTRLNYSGEIYIQTDYPFYISIYTDSKLDVGNGYSLQFVGFAYDGLHHYIHPAILNVWQNGTYLLGNVTIVDQNSQKYITPSGDILNISFCKTYSNFIRFASHCQSCLPSATVQGKDVSAWVKVAFEPPTSIINHENATEILETVSTNTSNQTNGQIEQADNSSKNQTENEGQPQPKSFASTSFWDDLVNFFKSFFEPILTPKKI